MSVLTEYSDSHNSGVTAAGPTQELALGRISLCELKLGEVTRHSVELNDGTGRAELDIELLYELVST